ncbi:DUF5995 family protein [Flavobacterium aestivum]|uniref:DUF5995 family protein n=1 Tax=Flavobacterium aestivum TaxID=3003257 RepID=UPI0022857460|nr:DUF5995 family protein [Flavobacterium aestivum]
MKQANTIEEVIQFLDEIIETSKQEQSAIGLFTALYREVTYKIRDGIANGLFQDGPRMEKLDVIFANRYLDAYYQYQKNEKPSGCWEFSFQKTEIFWPIVVQHLLLGINAHVNLDLGIASARVSTVENIETLKSDFDQINTILSDLVANVEKALTKIWPAMTIVLKVLGKIDNIVIDFSMKTARDGAWKFANEFVALPEHQREATIQERDVKITEVARLISNPGYFVSSAFKFIRLFERGTVSKKIIYLEEIE